MVWINAQLSVDFYIFYRPISVWVKRSCANQLQKGLHLKYFSSLLLQSANTHLHSSAYSHIQEQTILEETFWFYNTFLFIKILLEACHISIS